MKIQSIDIYALSIPFVVPYRLSKVYGTVSDNHAIVVRICTEGGLIGWGEANPLPPFTEETPSGVVDLLGKLLGPALIGHDAGNVARCRQMVDALVPGNPLAKGAVDMALHDLAGKAAGLPVHALIGGALVDVLPVLWPMGSGTLEEDRALVEAKYAEGFRTFMVKMGAQPIEVEIARIKALTERFHPEVKFIADANQGWQEAEALRFVAGANDTPLALLEQPVDRHDRAGLARIRQASLAPVSADESVFSLHQAAELAREGAVDTFSLKVSKNGGIASTREIATVAAANGMTCLMNSMLECGITQAASLQLGCTLANLIDCGHAYMSTLRLRDDFTDFGRLVRNGQVSVPGEPGLGIAVDEQKVTSLASDHVRLGPERVGQVRTVGGSAA